MRRRIMKLKPPFSSSRCRQLTDELFQAFIDKLSDTRFNKRYYELYPTLCEYAKDISKYCDLTDFEDKMFYSDICDYLGTVVEEYYADPDKCLYEKWNEMLKYRDMINAY